MCLAQTVSCIHAYDIVATFTHNIIIFNTDSLLVDSESDVPPPRDSMGSSDHDIEDSEQAVQVTLMMG